MSTLQQVNLYRPELRPQERSFSMVTILVAWGAVILLLASLQFWGEYQTRKSREQLANLERHQLKVLKQLATMRESNARTSNVQLDSEINKERAEVKRGRQLLQIMKGQNMGNASGFSDHLYGLSRQHMDGLSLEYFGLLRGGKYVELSGWTHSAELVPGYVQRLRNEVSFQDTRFGNMAIERIEAQRTDALRFIFGEAQEGGS